MELVPTLMLPLTKAIDDDKAIESSLHQAVKLGNVAIIRSLIKYSADISTYDNAGNSPLHLAIALENIMVANISQEPLAF
eukprot:Pgem_evm1s13374